MILMSCPAVSWPSRYDAGNQQHGEGDEVVEHLVAHRLREHVDGDAADRLARLRHLQPASRRRLGHLAHEEVLERVADRVQRDELCAAPRRAPPAAAPATVDAAARARSDRAPIVGTRSTRPAAAARSSVVGVDVRSHELPAANVWTPADLGQRPCGRQPAAGEDRHAAAERLGVGQHVRAEEHRAARDRAAAGSARGCRGGRAGRARTSARRGTPPRDR